MELIFLSKNVLKKNWVSHGTYSFQNAMNIQKSFVIQHVLSASVSADLRAMKTKKSLISRNHRNFH